MQVSILSKKCPFLLLSAAAILTTTFPLPASAAAAKKPAPQKHATDIKGQGQMVGGNGRFGVTYSLKNGFNVCLLGAHYSVDYFPAYDALFPDDNEKVLVIDFSVKNVHPEDTYVGFAGELFTVVDQRGNIYGDRGGSVALKSTGDEAFSPTLKPGQGMGQPSLHDPLRDAIRMPGDARIVKIIMNQSRLNSNEQIVRYFIAGSTPAEAGGTPDPANVIGPLPTTVHDPSDKSGAVALPLGAGARIGDGIEYPTGPFAIKLDSLADAPAGLKNNGNDPDEGKKFVILNVTLKNVDYKPQSLFDGSNTDIVRLVDTDGDQYEVVATLKPGSDASVDTQRMMEPGSTYQERFVFSLPTNAKAKQVIYAANRGRKWAFTP